MPDYYTEKVNLFVALAPAASVANVDVPFFQKLAPYWRELQWIVLKEKSFDLFNSNWWEEEAEELICAKIDPHICTGLLKYLVDADLEVDNLDRLNVFVKDIPAGQGYQGLVNYA